MTARQKALLLRVPILTTAITALFWGVWYAIVGSVPEVTEIALTPEYSWQYPMVYSRWYDILVAPMMTVVYMGTFFTVYNIVPDTQKNELVPAIVIVFVGGLVVGLFVGLVGGLVAGLVIGLVAGLVIGLVAGLVVGLVAGLVVGLVVGLVGGLVAGLVIGLVAGLVVGLFKIVHHIKNSQASEQLATKAKQWITASDVEEKVRYEKLLADPDTKKDAGKLALVDQNGELSLVESSKKAS